MPVAPGAMSGRTTTLPPSTTAGASRITVESFRIVPETTPSTSLRSAWISGTSAAVSARTVRSDPNPTARSRTFAVSPWTTSRAAPWPPKKSPFTGAESSAPPGSETWYEPRVGENTPEVDLGRAFRCVGRAADDRDLVDDDVAAAQGRPVDIGADGEDRDQDRHRDPRPLALVEALEDEVVDRADEGDVAEEQQHEPADRRQGERRQVRDRADDLAVVAAPDRPARPGRDQVAPERDGRLRSRRSSRRSGRRRSP